MKSSEEVRGDLDQARSPRREAGVDFEEPSVGRCVGVIVSVRWLGVWVLALHSF